MALGFDGTGEVAFGDALGRLQGLVDRFDDAAGQQQGTDQGQHRGGQQQADDQADGVGILIGSGLVDGTGLLGVDADQLIHDAVDLLGAVEHVAVDQGAQGFQIVALRSLVHAAFQLAVVAEQLHILVVGGTLLRTADQRFINPARFIDLLVALADQLEGVLQGVGFAVEQQAIGQGAQAQGQLGELIEVGDARHRGLLDEFAGLANFAHLVQGEQTQAQHQRADQGEPQQRARGDIHIT
ncbi:hypothetical protein D3C76_718910 [compost metagenome]